MKICIAVDLGDVIMDIEFKFENFRDFDVIRDKSLPFPIDFARGPYHSVARYRAAWLLYSHCIVQ